MNEQIKLLMGQALDEKFAGTWSVMDMQDLTKFADRFTQLIVEECAQRCDVVRENNGGDKQFGARLCADEIRYLNRRS
jgi:hypothetical protein